MERRKNEKKSIVCLCPIRNVVARFGNKWALLVILILSEEGQTRFNALGKLIPDISTKMLASTLRTLEADNLVNRKVYPEVPPRVEYSLTPTGETLVPIIHELTTWALNNMKSVISHRAVYELTAAK